MQACSERLKCSYKNQTQMVQEQQTDLIRLENGKKKGFNKNQLNFSFQQHQQKYPLQIGTLQGWNTRDQCCQYI